MHYIKIISPSDLTNNTQPFSFLKKTEQSHTAHPGKQYIIKPPIQQEASAQ